jgi:hypothetical protein
MDEVQAIEHKIFDSIKNDIKESGWIHEDNPDVNDLQRKLITAMKAKHPNLRLGVINLHNGATKIMWPWGGELVYNFEAAFVIPEPNPELEQMIKEYNALPYNNGKCFKAISEITDKIIKIGGHHLIWA